MDVAAIYADVRERVISLVTEAGEAALSRPVPATPEWTGKQLLGHLVGLPTDVLNGNVEGAGGDEWSGRQVREREGRSVAALVEEWRSTSAAFDSLLAGATSGSGGSGGGMMGAITSDAVQHELDLRGLLGVPVPESAEPAIEATLNFMVGFLDRRLKNAGLPALRLRAGNQEWTVGPADSEPQPAATLTTTTLELFRVIAGRRSVAQVRAMEWAGDPTPYLPVLSAFGPLSRTDVVESFG